MRPGVRYYCPRGVPKPAHRGDLIGGSELLPGKGPEVAGESDLAGGGGTVYGGAYTQGEEGWHRTEAKWWVHLGSTVPQHLARAAPNPRIVRWHLVVGAFPEHRWRVPVLLMRQPGDAEASGTEPVYVSALEREWRGDAKGWQAPADLVEMQERLHAVAHDLATGASLEDEWTAITDLTLSMLEQGHTISRHEIAVGRWLTELTLLRILAAGCDITDRDGAA